MSLQQTMLRIQWMKREPGSALHPLESMDWKQLFPCFLISWYLRNRLQLISSSSAGFDVKAGESSIVPVMLYDAKLATLTRASLSSIAFRARAETTFGASAGKEDFTSESQTAAIRRVIGL